MLKWLVLFVFRFVLYELRSYIQAGQVLLYWMGIMYFGWEEYRDRLLVGKQTHIVVVATYILDVKKEKMSYIFYIYVW